MNRLRAAKQSVSLCTPLMLRIGPMLEMAMIFFGVGFCNTLGVCRQLSNGFELKHDMLSGDEDVKVKPMEMSPNLNADIAPLLYI